MFRFLAVCIFGAVLVAGQPDFGILSKVKPGDATVQAVADAVKAKIEEKNGAGSATLNKVVQYKTRFVDMPTAHGGLTGGVVYYMKIEASPGKYIQADVLQGDGRNELSQAKATTKDAEIEEF
ncbi:uncharacterized protein LOC129589847 isoform X1 [Paramacrobiotus metropolitanus]|uniref:uncharacterized protein LOC129589847 isoform X1 n=1 Tax=Paramacrobiotus metropolitanus TaxID=2943436 RepID=UPI002445F483|nr:uncharacterized protein LOC129589847 isoform X1 [Paramacrobiotus metropolitanus]